MTKTLWLKNPVLFCYRCCLICSRIPTLFSINSHKILDPLHLPSPPSSPGATCLHLAAAHGRTTAVEVLLRAGLVRCTLTLLARVVRSACQCVLKWLYCAYNIRAVVHVHMMRFNNRISFLRPTSVLSQYVHTYVRITLAPSIASGNCLHVRHISSGLTMVPCGCCVGKWRGSSMLDYTVDAHSSLRCFLPLTV